MSINTKESCGSREARDRHTRDDRLARAQIAAQLLQAAGMRDVAPQHVRNEFKDMLRAVEEYVDNG